jgi:hypothetical protein
MAQKLDDDQKKALLVGAGALGLIFLCWRSKKAKEEGELAQAELPDDLVKPDFIMPDKDTSLPSLPFVPSGTASKPGAPSLPGTDAGAEGGIIPGVPDEEEMPAITSKGVSSGDVMLGDRPAFLLAPSQVTNQTPIFIILHGGYGERGKPHRLGMAALTGSLVGDVLTFEGAADQALAIMGKQAQNQGYLVVYLAADHRKQWSASDVEYIQSAVAQIQRDAQALGPIKVSGSAAGLMIADQVVQALRAA